jgi:hypothetical protein
MKQSQFGVVFRSSDGELVGFAALGESGILDEAPTSRSECVGVATVAPMWSSPRSRTCALSNCPRRAGLPPAEPVRIEAENPRIQSLPRGYGVELSNRETWGLIHGLLLGSFFPLAFAGGLAELCGLRTR